MCEEIFYNKEKRANKIRKIVCCLLGGKRWARLPRLPAWTYGPRCASASPFVLWKRAGGINDARGPIPVAAPLMTKETQHLLESGIQRWLVAIFRESWFQNRDSKQTCYSHGQRRTNKCTQICISLRELLDNSKSLKACTFISPA